MARRANLTAGDGAQGDGFSGSVAMSGSLAIVGARGHGGGAGAAYVFARSGNSFSQQAELTNPNGLAGDGFGSSVGISGFGWSVAISATTAVIGEPGANTVWTYARSGMTWSYVAAGCDDCGSADGWSVSISGNTLIEGDRDAERAVVQSPDFLTWAPLSASDGASGDGFGYSVSISGSTLLVGAPNHSGTSAAYVFTGSGTSWSQQAELTAADGASGDEFGYSVAISSLDTAIIGAPYDNGTGAAYIFGNL